MSAGPYPVEDPISAALRELCPPVCVECDYSLVGLPPGARCPECGAESNLGVLTLRGWSPGSIATMRPGRMMTQIGIIVALAVIYGAMVTRRRSPVFMLIYFVAMMIWPVTQLLLHWLRGGEARAPVRLRLCSAGFDQRLGPGRLKLVPWDPRMQTQLNLGSTGRHRLIVRWPVGSFVLTTRSHLVTFDFDGDAQQAQLLAAQIRGWISYSK
jgi:hypothetical protein